MSENTTNQPIAGQAIISEPVQQPKIEPTQLKICPLMSRPMNLPTQAKNPNVIPIYMPCIGDKCQLWQFNEQNGGQCSFKLGAEAQVLMANLSIAEYNAEYGTDETGEVESGAK